MLVRMQRVALKQIGNHRPPPDLVAVHYAMHTHCLASFALILAEEAQSAGARRQLLLHLQVARVPGGLMRPREQPTACRVKPVVCSSAWPTNLNRTKCQSVLLDKHVLEAVPDSGRRAEGLSEGTDAF